MNPAFSSLSALLILVVLGNLSFAVKGIPLQTGHLNISETLQEWGCSGSCLSSQHCRLPRCGNVVFPFTFSGSGTVQVHVTLSHGEKFSRVHSPVAVWVESVSTRGFKVCARESGIGTNGTGVLNWLAFQDQPQLSHGSVSFNGIWTTETKCEKVTFSQSFGGRPSIFVSAKYTRDTKPDDAMYVWLENVKPGSFEVCIREFLVFDGKHQDTIVDWFAFTGKASELNFTITGEVYFPNSGSPTADNNYGFCQEVQYNTTFYKSPAVLVSVGHQYDRQVKSHVPPENNLITAWVEEVRLTSMRICVKDLSGTGSQHDPLTVSYVVIGDLNPCLGVVCESFGVCKTYSAHEARCVCNEDCPSYQDPVCTANGTTYDDKCLYELSFCKGYDNNTIYHPGSCEGFPIAHGRVKLLRVPNWCDSSCKTVEFPPYRFYPDKQVHVQITLNHMNLNDSVTVHHAITSWTENLNTQNFTVCAMQSGRNGNNFNPIATVEWMAYQGATPEVMTGIISIKKWWSGTNCEDMTFPKDKFKEAPVVLVTSEHLRTGKEHDAALIWTEDVTKDSFKVCLRELQNFDGKHEYINVNWMAFSKLHKPLFTEHGSVKFPNTNPPTDENNNAYCEFVPFTRSYNITPSVLVSANHSTTASGNLAPVHNGITTWIENMNASGFRVCIKELYETRYDPVSVSYAVLTDICEPGWSYFNGFCYFTSETYTNWTNALSKCQQANSVLVDVNSNEENVYIQHRHNGEKSWLGLNDRSTEGDFTWADVGRANFTAWAKNQPNNNREEDCVHALGLKLNYKWNDVKCSDCHQYTCKKDLNECERNTYYCDQLATCVNKRGSYSCRCSHGDAVDGFSCYYAGLRNSDIVGRNENYLLTLTNWLKPVAQSKSSDWKRCWRASVDGWASSTFHGLCDSKGPTVTIIRVGGRYIFGGYTSISWSSSCGYRYNSAAFLFSLVNQPGWKPLKIYQTGKYSSFKANSMYSCSSRGPTFGGGHDFCIATYASATTNSFSNLGYTYGPPTGHSYGSSFAKTFLAGSYNFQPDEVEVFYETT
ncbi:uncharacterized protein LOC144664642 isoform X1 [Oculina patagonica]